jgi:serine/threonine-protein kinase
MSPEQAQGKRVDARSDIFSFGVVMYEMLTGTKAFASDSAISTLTAILRDEVKPVGELVQGVPAEVVEIIALALKKDPKDRWQSMQVVHKVLAEQKQKFDSGVFTNSGIGQTAAAAGGRSTIGAPPSGPPSAAPTPGLTRPRKSGRVWMWIAIGFGFVVWGKTCGSSRNRTKIETSIPGVSVSVPGVGITNVPSRAAKKGTLTNQSILDMLEAEVPATVIVSHIHASKTRFTLTTDEIIKLTKAGATPEILEAMRNPTAPEKPETPPPTTPSK